MNIRIRFCVTSAILGLISAPAALSQPAPSPHAAAPAGARWIVDESGQMCAMARPVAAGPVTLMITSYPGSGRFELRLVAPSWSSSVRRGSERVAVSLEPGSTAYERRLAISDLPDNGGEAITLFVPGEFLERFAATSGIRLAVDRREIGAYAVPQAAAVSRVFADCEANKLIEWGADPSGFGPGATRAQPIGSSDDWVERDVLEEGTAPRGRHTLGVNRLDLDNEGRPVRCTPIDGNLSTAAQGRVCDALMRNARYQPARDRNGSPVRSVVTHRIDLYRLRHISVEPM